MKDMIQTGRNNTCVLMFAHLCFAVVSFMMGLYLPGVLNLLCILMHIPAIFRFNAMLNYINNKETT